VWVNPAFPQGWWAEAAAAGVLDDGVRGPFEPIRSSRHTDVMRGRLVFRGRVMDLYIKRFRHRSPIDALKHVVRPSRARRDAIGADRLRSAGLRAPVIAAVADRRIGPMCLESLAITLAVSGEPLYAYVQRTAACPELRPQRHAVLRALGRCVGRMHAAGIVHGDLRPGNVLVDPVTEPPTFTFLDNERTARHRRIPDPGRLKNLVQINMLPTGLSRTDRLRFWRAYLAENPTLQPAARIWADRIAAVTARRMEHKLDTRPTTG